MTARSIALACVLAAATSRAHAAPGPTCDQVVSVWKRLQRAMLLGAISAHEKPNADDRARIDRQVETSAKELGGACRKFSWSPAYRRCFAGATKAAAFESCFRTEYARGKNRERCEPLLDHYMTLADADFADLYAGNDQAWIDDFRGTHRDTMRPWCIERGLVSDTGATCARAAKTRSEFMACGKVDE